MSTSLYERVGGETFFRDLVDRFYTGVAEDPVLRPLYPEDPAGFAASNEHLRLFLLQYWGGPRTYDEQRGHPRLRLRHAPFVIGLAERDAWLRHMLAALAAAHLAPEDEEEMAAYFRSTATQLINHAGASTR